MTRSRALGLALAALFLGGCFQNRTGMKVNADGSGTIVITSKMKATAIKQMKEMAKSFGGDNAKEPELFSEKQAREKAPKMGEGVEFVSYEPVKEKDFEGEKVTYAFKDLSKVKLNEMAEPPSDPASGLKSQSPKGDPITFKFGKQANGNSLITVVNPKREMKPEAAPDAPPPGAPPGGEMPEEQLAMMKEMMGGLRITIELEVAGTLVKTNSPHVNCSTVTLLDMDFDKVLGDMAKFKKFAAKPPQSAEEAKAMLKDFPGVKINLEPETTIEFSGK